MVRHEAAALIGNVLGRVDRTDPNAASAKMRAMLDHYEHHGLLGNARRLRGDAEGGDVELWAIYASLRFEHQGVRFLDYLRQAFPRRIQPQSAPGET